MAPLLPLIAAPTTISSRVPAPVQQPQVAATRPSTARVSSQQSSQASAAAAPALKSQTRKLLGGPGLVPPAPARPDDTCELGPPPLALCTGSAIPIADECSPVPAAGLVAEVVSSLAAAPLPSPSTVPAASPAAPAASTSSAAACSAPPSAPVSVAGGDCCSQSQASTSWGGRSAAAASRASCRDQNSVTIKETTIVKDAAGALDKILSRGVTALVTALRPDCSATYASLNQAVKSIAVARQYVKDKAADDEVTFLPFHRLDAHERPDPSRFAFLVFRTLGLAEALKTADRTDLNVSRSSDINKMANAIISVVLDRGQAVMKAAGNDAIFVAMSAVVNARHRLIQKHGFDLQLAAAWITEDTMSTLGRESKFLRFNVMRSSEINGPKSDVPPTLPADGW